MLKRRTYSLWPYPPECTRSHLKNLQITYLTSKPECFSPEIRYKATTFSVAHHYYHSVLHRRVQSVESGKKNTANTQIVKDVVKLPLFTGNVMLFVETPKEYTNTLLKEQIHKFKQDYRIQDQHTNQLYA